MARLAVNVDHVATLRQARRINEPEPVLAALTAELAGAEGIICHLREDRRHIQDRDLRILRQVVKTKLNLEMAGVPEMVKIALEVKPDLVTLVPEKREELTTEGGLDVQAKPEPYREVIRALQAQGMRVSLFIDPDLKQIQTAAEIGADLIEIHTGHYAEAHTEAEAVERFGRIARAAAEAERLRLDISVGHGLNYVNVQRFKALPQVTEYSIGHSIIARAVMVGMERAVREMVELIKGF